jgi:hypothetical protein
LARLLCERIDVALRGGDGRGLGRVALLAGVVDRGRTCAGAQKEHRGECCCGEDERSAQHRGGGDVRGERT